MSGTGNHPKLIIIQKTEKSTRKTPRKYKDKNNRYHLNEKSSRSGKVDTRMRLNLDSTTSRAIRKRRNSNASQEKKALALPKIKSSSIEDPKERRGLKEREKSGEEIVQECEDEIGIITTGSVRSGRSKTRTDGELHTQSHYIRRESKSPLRPMESVRLKKRGSNTVRIVSDASWENQEIQESKRLNQEDNTNCLSINSKKKENNEKLALAKYKIQGMTDGDLSCEAGAIIILTTTSGSWWYGYIEGEKGREEGRFSSNWVELVNVVSPNNNNNNANNNIFYSGDNKRKKSSRKTNGGKESRKVTTGMELIYTGKQSNLDTIDRINLPIFFSQREKVSPPSSVLGKFLLNRWQHKEKKKDIKVE